MAGLAHLCRDARSNHLNDLSYSDRGATEFGRSPLTKSERLMVAIDMRFVLRDA